MAPGGRVASPGATAALRPEGGRYDPEGNPDRGAGGRRDAGPGFRGGRLLCANETNLGMTCALRREGSAVLDRFALPAGGEWSQSAERDGPRILRCAGGRIEPRFRMRPGVRYALVQLRTGMLALVARR